MPVFLLSKVSLRKGDRECTLLGTIHLGSPEVYKQIQEEADAAHKRGCTVLYEGISTGPWRKPATPAARKICTSLLELLRGEPLKPAHSHLSKETDHVLLPAFSVHADMHVAELADLCVEYGIPEDISVRGLRSCFDPKRTDTLAVLVRKVLVFERNLHVAMLITHYPGDVLVLYGDGHIEGIDNILRADGWGDRVYKNYAFQII